jgi:hypothetical protein
MPGVAIEGLAEEVVMRAVTGALVERCLVKTLSHILCISPTDVKQGPKMLCGRMALRHALCTKICERMAQRAIAVPARQLGVLFIPTSGRFDVQRSFVSAVS